MKYQIIKKYAGSKPIGTVLDDDKSSLTLKDYPEYFKPIKDKISLAISYSPLNS